MSIAAQIEELVESYLDAVYELHHEVILDEGVMEFVAQVTAYVNGAGIHSMNLDHVAADARAYARDYLRDLDGRD